MNLTATPPGSGKKLTNDDNLQKEFSIPHRHSIRPGMLVRKLTGLPARRSDNQVLLKMKCLAALLFFSLLTYSNGKPQENITINKAGVPIQAVFRLIEQQSDHVFFFNEKLLANAKPVTIHIKNASLQEALAAVFKDQPLTYAIIQKNIIVKRIEDEPAVQNTTTRNISNKPGYIAVTGKVLSRGEPVPGATVSVRDLSMMTTTDAIGQFDLSGVPENAIISVSSVSHQGKEIYLNGRTSLTIDLSEKTQDLDEAVVVAYNTTSQRSNTGAVTVVKGKEIETLPSRSFDRSLQGLVPGLLVTTGDGQPGSAPSNFVLRGIATAVDPINEFNSVRNPLIVIDGVPVSQDLTRLTTSGTHGNPLAQINPSNLESITVLKDAAAVALYGSRASNGVILVTTKNGKTGKTIFNFRHQTDIASRLKGKVEMLNQQEYIELLFEAYKNFDPALTEANILADLQSKFPTKSDGSFYPAPDWYKELFNTHATTFSNELAISGGNEKNNFYLNLEYTKQNGVIKKSDYDRKSLRFNFENKATNWLKFGVKSAFSYNVQNYFNGIGHIPPFLSPLNPVRLADGNYALHYLWGGSFNTEPNPAAVAEYNTYQNTSFRGLSKIYCELNFFKYFKISSNLGVDFMLTEAKEKADPRLIDLNNFSTGTGSVSERDIRRSNLITTNLLQFDKVFSSKHAIGIVLGQEAQILNQKDLFLRVTGLQLPYYDQLSSPGISIAGNPWSGGFRTKETLLSFFGQANYSFKNKYFFTSSLRRDGSSRFGDDRKYGTYWSTGLGWIITSEPFMQHSSSWLNYLKIRGSIGSSGYAGAINAFTRFDRLFNYTFLNGIAVYQDVTPGNPDVQWEETFTWDAGLEARLLKERITLTLDIYERNTTDLLYQVSLPQSTGFQKVLSNIGKMENKGIELSLSIIPIQNKNFHWNFNANWSTNQNKLVKANVPMVSLLGGILGNKEGENFNSFYLVRWAGVNPANGMPQWLDSAGNISSVYPSSLADRKFVGKPQPDGFGAITNTLTFKNFEIAAMFYYQYGFQIYDGQSNLLNDGSSPYINQTKQALDRWQKPGDNTTNPRRILNNPAGGSNASTRYLFDGDYIRLQNASIAYNFPKKAIAHLHLAMLKLFVQGHNLAIWTKYPGRDPSDVSIIGNIQSTYPNQLSFSIGLNASF